MTPRPSPEDRKEEIVTFLKQEAAQSRYWHTINQIAHGVGYAHATTKQAIYDLASEGFLSIRDADTDNTEMMIAIKKSLRDSARWVGGK